MPTITEAIAEIVQGVTLTGCTAATTVNVALTGTQTIDGVALEAGERVIVKDQTDASENGIYVVAEGAWSRSSDMNGSNDIVSGAIVSVTEGTNYGGALFTITFSGDLSFGTTEISFNLISGSTTSLGGLSDVDLTGAETGDILVRDGDGDWNASEFFKVLGTPISKYGLGYTHAAIVAAEADSSATYINLEGQEISTTLTESALTKNYVNGYVKPQNASGNESLYHRKSPLFIQEIQRRETKSPIRDWENKSIGWYGTSIPHQLDSEELGYPYLVAKALGATVTNWSWSGSHLTYDPEADHEAGNSVKALTMTDVDLAEQLAEHGSSSVYDNSFDAVTNPENMTMEHRVYEPQIASPYDVIFCDHNHNDRQEAPGTLSPTEYTISGITKGATTTITLSDATGIAQYDGVILKVLEGIDDLRYYAGSVSSVSGNDITLSVDSSSMSGSFSSGTLVKVDRTTMWGAMDFFAYGAWNGAIRGGKTAGAATLPPIIWNGAPSEYTADGADPANQSIRSNADYIYQWVETRNAEITSDELDLPYHSFFDLTERFAVNYEHHTLWLSDSFHPTDEPATRGIANHFVDWALGGAGRTWDKSEILTRGSAPEPTNQYPVIYSRFYGGYGTPEWSEGDLVQITDESWANLTAWTSNTGSAVVGGDTDNWNGGTQVLDVTVTDGDTAQYVELESADFDTATNFDDGIQFDFPFYIPDVDGHTSSGSKTCTVMSVDTGSTGHVQIQFLVRSSGMGLRAGILDKLPGSGGVWTYTQEYPDLVAANSYTVRLVYLRGTASYNGGLALFVRDDEADDPQYVLVGKPIRVDDSARTADTQFRFGCVAATAESTFTYELGPLQVHEFPVTAWTSTIADLAAGGGASELDDLSDVDTSGGAEGDVLTQQSDGSYAPETPGSSFTDVNVTGEYQVGGSMVLDGDNADVSTGYKIGGTTRLSSAAVNVTNGYNINGTTRYAVAFADVTTEYRIGSTARLTASEANVTTQYKINGTVRFTSSYVDVTSQYRIGGTARLTSSIANVTTGYQVNGTQVVGAQQTNITDITDNTGGTASQNVNTMDATFTSAYGTSAARINSNFASVVDDLDGIKAVLRAHGLMG